jgi:hypothetical protein
MQYKPIEKILIQLFPFFLSDMLTEIQKKIKEIEIPALFPFFFFILLILQLCLIPLLVIEWDEYNAASQIFSFQSGHPIKPFRNGLVSLFWFFNYLPFHEYIIIIFLRYSSFVLGILGIYFFVYKITRHIFGNEFVYIPLLFLVANYTFLESATQYRTDPICNLLFLMAFYFILKRYPEKIIFPIPAVSLALALYINPKSIYQLIIVFLIYGYLLLNSNNKKDFFLRIIYFAVSCLVLFLLLTTIHCYVFNITIDWNTILSKVENVQKTGFGSIHGISWKIRFIKNNFKANPIVFLLMISGIFILFYKLIKTKKNINYGIIIILVLGEFATLLIHQGTYKYYTINVFPVSVLAATLPMAIIMRSLSTAGKNKFFSVSGLVVIIILPLFFYGNYSRFRHYKRFTMKNQINYNIYLREMFPEKVIYMDGINLLGKYRNFLGMFSNKQKILYFREKSSLWLDILRDVDPIFLISSYRFPVEKLNKYDRKKIEQSYIRYFDYIYIYGKKWKNLKVGEPVTFHINNDGSYFIKQSGLQVQIDNNKISSSPFFLKKGEHTITVDDNYKQVELVFGRKRYHEHIPNYIIKPSAKENKIFITREGYYYHNYHQLKKQKLKPIRIDGRRVKEDGIFLKKGEHLYTNKNEKSVILHPFGPLFYSNGWFFRN